MDEGGAKKSRALRARRASRTLAARARDFAECARRRITRAVAQELRMLGVGRERPRRSGPNPDDPLLDKYAAAGRRGNAGGSLSEEEDAIEEIYSPTSCRSA